MTAAAAPTSRVEFDSGWRSFDGIHGGLVVATVLRAAAEATGAVPAAVTAHFHRPVQAGAAELTVGPERGGRTVSSLVELSDSVTALVRLTRDAGEITLPATGFASYVADPAALPRLDVPVDFVPFAQHLDIRPINDARPFAGGDTPEFDVWIRLDPSLGLAGPELAAVLLDALPPALYATRTAPVPIPTAEFSAHFVPTGRSRSSWHRLRHRTVWASETLCVDETELFAPSGDLTAQARQLRRILAS
ncbi:thioesterase family protein [Rhodococcus kronopolitis]|uniref:Thioesterase family protein n=1 Tax=Rhodococcus kronopolitis TaxID=1460226 RepID=A0ABV9FRV3_9NOCA